MDIMKEKEKISKLYFSNYFLIAFGFLKQDEVFEAFLKLLKVLVDSSDFEENLSSYFDFISKLFKKKYDNFSKYLLDLIQNTAPNELYKEYDPNKELNIINNFALVNYEEITGILNEKFPNKANFISQLPKYNTLALSELEPKEEIKLFNNIFELNQAFIFDNDFEIKPVKIMENIKFSDLKVTLSKRKYYMIILLPL